MGQDRQQLTAKALDWPDVMRAFSEGASTALGREAAGALVPSRDLRQITAWLDEVDEIRSLSQSEAYLPVSGVEDIRIDLRRAEKGAVLELEELRRAALTLIALRFLGNWIRDRDEELPRLRVWAERLFVDDGVVDNLADAFDGAGELSASRWPELASLRDRIAALHTRVRSFLDDFVRDDSMADLLQDRFVTQRGDRYVVPVKINYKRKELGIVHGVSGSGQTAFIEPHAVVEMNNELRLAEGALEALRHRILSQLSASLARVAVAAQAALKAATQLDVAVARSRLADRLEATRPAVGDEGEVHLVAARHPLLVLRGLDVVANDLHIGASEPVLIVSGPNTGGKTIALKTLGLCALLVRVGCFVPAEEGSRVDLMPYVTALVGDQQTVQGDRSSFSGHLETLKEMLELAGPGCLFLVDEIASGTDPQQGAALAHAMLERWADNGARALITTHFQRLKTLASSDGRIGIAGMQFDGDRPTFRMVRGASGDSHALEIARGIGIEESLITRAKSLMEHGERQLAEALATLDAQRAAAMRDAERAEATRLELTEKLAKVEARERALMEKAEGLKAERVARFMERVSGAEKAIGAVVADLQRAPSHEGVESARAAVKALRAVVPQPAAPTPLSNETWKVGDRVRIEVLGEAGSVTGTGKKIAVRTDRGLTVKVDPGTLVRIAADSAPRAKPKPAKRIKRREARRDRSDAQQLLDAAVRFDGNTLDLRGQRVDEGLDMLEQFLDQAVMDSQGVVFVLHGHGTGAMKQAVRQWLPRSGYAAASRAAHPDQGGDAYTVVTLK